MMKVAIIFLITSCAIYSCLGHRPVFVCYFTQTSYFSAQQVPSNMRTHLIYAFGVVSHNGITFENGEDKAQALHLLQLKKRNPRLKVLISVQKGFPSVVNSASLRTQFATASAEFLRKYDFDGIDLDWEFPSSSEKSNYSLFIKTIRKIFNANNLIYHGSSPLMLTMALPNNKYYLRYYDQVTINRNVDFFTIMAYDFHVFNAKHDNQTGFNSPLYPVKGEAIYTSVTGLVNSYLSIGYQSSKLILGIPTYGRSYKLKDPSNHQLHSPATGRGDPGPYRHLKGVFSYTDTCVALNKGAVMVTDKASLGRYLYYNNTWVSFDDKVTVHQKCKYAIEGGMAGVGVWSMELDDIVGVCKGSTKFPLLTLIHKYLFQQ